jgi:hypothetical protein
MVRGAGWKPFEIELIRKLYPNCEKEKLLKLLPNRTWRAISDEAQRLGIRTKTRRLVKTFPDYPSNLKIGSIGEEFAKALLEREGYKVYRFSKICSVYNNKIERLAEAKTFVKSVNIGTPNVYDRIPSLKQGTQMPDFIAFKGNEVLIVEVKTGQSTLYPSQRSILLKSLDYGLTPLIVKVTAYKYFPSRKD